jgi:hypothetical protein
MLMPPLLMLSANSGLLCLRVDCRNEAAGSTYRARQLKKLAFDTQASEAMPNKHSCVFWAMQALNSASPGRLGDSAVPWQALRLPARGDQTWKVATQSYEI